MPLLLKQPTHTQVLKTNYYRYRQLIPVLLLVICSISTIITALGGTFVLAGVTYNFALSAKHYAAFAVTAVAVVSFFSLRNYYKYFLILIFMLEFFNIVSYTVIQASMGLNFGELHVGLSPLAVLFGLAVYFLNSRKINFHLFALVKPSNEKIAQMQQEEIADFKIKFSRKSSSELTQIVAMNKLIPSAITAAREMLRERQ